MEPHGLAEVCDRSQIDALLASPLNSEAVSEGSVILYDNQAAGVQQQFNGLLPVLALAFWPDDLRGSRKQALQRAKDKARTEEAARRRSLVSQGVLARPDELRTKPMAKDLAKHRSFGLARGTRVHHQVEDAVYMDPQSFKNKYGRLMPSAADLLTAMHRLGVIPVKPEWLVVDPLLAIGVRFDMLGVKRDGTLVFIENKTSGSKAAFEAEGPDMTGVLRGVLRDSDMNRAFVQLAFSILVAIKRFSCIRRYEAYVLLPRAKDHPSAQNAKSNKGAHVYPLSVDFINRYGVTMYNEVKKIR